MAEVITRLGASPLDDESVEGLEAPLVELLEPPGSLTRAHDDPDPGRRVMRRMLQRLDGMGKWGGYHTASDHVARGLAGTSARWPSSWASGWRPVVCSSRSRVGDSAT